MDPDMFYSEQNRAVYEEMRRLFSESEAVSYTHLDVYKRQVERRVEISNYMMFAPVFFASIGLKTDISGLPPDIMLFCVCFVIVALITKRCV